ncbi:DNA/RNA non-specific endonuclease [Salinarimonas soli]|uniref:Endonuclease n=1 Tax=Salinarimonas soli TaxID=1638099 RepID=A0A5B2VGG4_9HYPH|nr:DNA/RNA non-specific endonuclease [Salinarimonas soli]KAA2238005.1 DNA/RNA non-specific endonuclease [Salinarimonas soli]
MIARLLVALALLAGSPALAAPTACPEHFATGHAPDLLDAKLTPETRPLCYSGFAVLHSGLTRTPLWAAEHLTRETMRGARRTDRVDDFHADPNLPRDERAELSDYARSGFDRGHMAPAGDMPDAQAQEESFSLANMVPQNPELNRHLWERIESATRDIATREGEVFAVTGPVFQGAEIGALHGRVLVPTHVFKAIYLPARRAAGAYVAANREGGGVEVVSIRELARLTGIDPFPSLPAQLKAQAADLPIPADAAPGADVPRTSSTRRRAEPPSAAPPPGDFLSGLLDAIDGAGRR